MVYRAIAVIALLISISACSGKKANLVSAQGMTMVDVYSKGVGDSQKDTTRYMHNHLKVTDTFGYVKPYIPVISPPVVRKVWVPDHRSDEDQGILVAGHWVYLMVQGPRWFIEQEGTNVNVPVIIPSAPQQQKVGLSNGN